MAIALWGVVAMLVAVKVDYKKGIGRRRVIRIEKHKKQRKQVNIISFYSDMLSTEARCYLEKMELKS